MSSTDLVEMHIARIEAHDGVLNAIPVRTFERARQAAQQADARLAAGDTAPLLGLPLTLKESTLTAGLPQSAGMLHLKDYRPTIDGPVATRGPGRGLSAREDQHPGRVAGLAGGQPGLWADEQPVGCVTDAWGEYRGRRCGPRRRPDPLGSGERYRGLDSRAGGLLWRLWPSAVRDGHPQKRAVPPGRWAQSGAPDGGAGPAGAQRAGPGTALRGADRPRAGEAVGWQLHLPPARHQRLADFRVALLPPLLGAQASAAMQARLEALAQFLSRAGATVAEVAPAVDFQAYYDDYLRLLAVMTTVGMSRAQREAQAATLRQEGASRQPGACRGAGDGCRGVCAARGPPGARPRRLARLFSGVGCGARAHDPRCGLSASGGPLCGEAAARRQPVAPVCATLLYAMPAIFAGLPSTAFPGGVHEAGLPLGLQAIGPYLEDRTTLKFAQLVEEAWYRFEPPPGYGCATSG